MKRFLKYLGWIVLILFLVVNIVSAFNAYKFTHYYEASEAPVLLNQPKTTWEKFTDAFFGVKFYKKTDKVITDTAYHKVFLTTKDGIKLEGCLIHTDSAKGTVIMFHGHGGNKADIIPEAKAFRKLGYNTFLLDFRAHGNSGGNTTTMGYKESEDVKLAYNFIKGEGEKHIILWGVSLGASTITHAIYDYHILPDKIILELPFGSLLSAVEGRLRTMDIPAEPFSTLLTFWGGIENGFWGFSNNPCEYAKSITCPALLQFGDLDPRVSKEEAHCIYENISAPRKIVFYDNCKHESLYLKQPDKWINEVSHFLNNVPGQISLKTLPERTDMHLFYHHLDKAG